MNINEKLKVIKLFFDVNGLSYLYYEDIFKKVYNNYKLKVYLPYKIIFDYSIKFLFDKLKLENYIKIGDIYCNKRIYVNDCYFEGIYGDYFRGDVKNKYIYILFEESYKYLKKIKIDLGNIDVYLLTSKKVLKKINK